MIPRQITDQNVSFYIYLLGLHLQHMEFPRLGVESELQLPAYTTASATSDLSCVCDLYHSSWQSQILNLLSENRDWTFILMDASQIRFCWAMTESPFFLIFINSL